MKLAPIIPAFCLLLFNFIAIFCWQNRHLPTCVNVYACMHICTYHKQKKLSERKLSQFSGFYPNLVKTFAFYYVCFESAVITQSICRENF